MHSNALINHGVIIRPGRAPEGPSKPGRTFIISGIGRGGTTLVANTLRTAGIFFGEDVADLVGEDRHMLHILRSRNPGMLDDLIAKRNASGRDWGFKVPHLAIYLPAEELVRFRNPHLILIYRDPVAITVRHAIAEHVDPLPALLETTNAMHGLTQFLGLTTCPALLVSYEKALIFPEAFIDALAGFCTFPVTEEFRQQMLSQVKPNSDAYITGARRQYAGAIDYAPSGLLSGWCCEVGSSQPIDLDIFLDGNKFLTIKADEFRAELVPAGFGDGKHGFSINLAAFGVRPDVLLKVRVSGRTFELTTSSLPDDANGRSPLVKNPQ